MDAELAERGVDGGHLGGEIGGDMHLLARRENVELLGVEDQPAAARADRLPEILRCVGAGRSTSITLPFLTARKPTMSAPARPTWTTSPSRNASGPSTRAAAVVPGAQAPRRKRDPRAGAQPQLVQSRPLAHPYGKTARRDLHPQRAVVAGGGLVEGGAVVDDQADENVEPAGRAFRVGGARRAYRARRGAPQRGDVDDALLQHRAFACQRDALGRQGVEPLAHGGAAAGQETRAQAIGFLGEPEVEAGGLDLRGLDDALGGDRAVADQRRRRAGAPAGRERRTS